MGGKVLIPTQNAVRNLIAARLAADVMGVPTILLARTDANAADLLTSGFQFVTLAGFHALNHSIFELAHGYRERGMTAYSELQQAEFTNESKGYSATRHQREVGTGYFDEVTRVITGGTASTTALTGSTEAEQF